MKRTQVRHAAVIVGGAHLDSPTRVFIGFDPGRQRPLSSIRRLRQTALNTLWSGDAWQEVRTSFMLAPRAARVPALCWLSCDCCSSKTTA